MVVHFCFCVLRKTKQNLLFLQRAQILELCYLMKAAFQIYVIKTPSETRGVGEIEDGKEETEQTIQKKKKRN